MFEVHKKLNHKQDNGGNIEEEENYKPTKQPLQNDIEEFEKAKKLFNEKMEKEFQELIKKIEHQEEQLQEMKQKQNSANHNINVRLE